METASGAFSAAPPASTATSPSPPTSPPPGSPMQPHGVCGSFACASVLLPTLLATLVSATLLGCALMTASYSYIALKQRDRPSGGTKVVLILVVALQTAQTTIETGKALDIFGIDYGDLSSLSRPRLAKILAPLFAIMIQLTAQLFLIRRVHQALQAERGVGEWTRRFVVFLLGAGWTVSAVGGVGVCTQIKRSSTFLPGRPGAQAFDSYALIWLVSAAVVAVGVAASLIHSGGLQSNRCKRKSTTVQRILSVLSAGTLTGGYVAVAQVLVTFAWILSSRMTSSTWVEASLAALPSLYSCTAVSLLSSPATRPRPLSRPRKGKAIPVKATSTTSRSSEFFDRPFLLYSSSTDRTSTTVSCGEAFRSPPAPPYSEPGRSRLPSSAPTFRTAATHHRPPPPASSERNVEPAVSHPYSSPLVSFSTTEDEHTSSAISRSNGRELATVTRPTCIIEVDEEGTLVVEPKNGCQPVHEEEPEKEKEKRAVGRKCDTVTKVFEEVGRMERTQGWEEERRRKGALLIEKAEKGENAKHEEEKPHCEHRRPSLGASTSRLSTRIPSLHSGRCSTASLHHYDPVPFSSPSPPPSIPSYLTDSPIDPVLPFSSSHPTPPPPASPPPSVGPPTLATYHTPPPVLLPPPQKPFAVAAQRHARWSSVVSGVTQASDSSFGCRDARGVVGMV